MAVTVNLDALVRREDFEVVEDKRVSQLNAIMLLGDIKKIFTNSSYLKYILIFFLTYYHHSREHVIITGRR